MVAGLISHFKSQTTNSLAPNNVLPLPPSLWIPTDCLPINISVEESYKEYTSSGSFPPNTTSGVEGEGAVQRSIYVIQLKIQPHPTRRRCTQICKKCKKKKLTQKPLHML